MLHTKKVLVPDGLGQPGHLLGISEDVTEQRAMEREIRKLNTELQERAKHLEAVNKDLESFSYSASHDLRSPLSVIGGYVGLLEKRYAGQLDQTGLEYLSTIRSNVKLMSQLIYDLLAFSRCSQQAIASADLDMNQLVDGVVQEVLQGYPGDKTPKLSVGPLPPASADPGLLRQVWMNLLSNAVKYSSKSPNPEIEVSGRTEGGEIVYSVRDNGAGFSMEHYLKLFEVFERLHGAEEFEGSGVGLAIVHRVVTRHGGRVWAVGKPNAGAVFHFSLPIRSLS
jgi:light-regulated signal transduction histidine kinase (bacteriophytochrome)